MAARADDDRLFDVAASISDGTPVDWNSVRNECADPADAAVVEQLRVLHGIAATHAHPGTWGALAILGPVGRGSFGVVYRAFDPDLRRDVALKISGAGASPALFDAERAVKEARMLARVRHPNVVTVFGAQRAGNEVGVWMELIKGHTLDDLVQRQGPFSAREATVIGMDLCRALAAVHGAGLLHGDIKAHNVMREEGGRTVLMDFGAGRDLKSEPLAPGVDVAGTPLYMAPEVFAGGGRTPASDIYSLGVLLYYLVTVAYPVDGDTRTEVGRRHEQRAPRRRLRDIRPDLPEAFIQVVERATAEDPAHRYATAGAFEAALSAGLDGPRPTTRARVDRHRPIVAATVLLAMALAGAAYWGLGGRAPSTVPAAAVAPSPLPPAGDATYQVDAALYRMEGGADVRLTSNARLVPGDRLSLHVQTSVPVHVYVVNEDDRGESYLLFPLPGQTPTNPLTAGQPNRLPGVQDGQEMYWQVTSAGGREHFLIFVGPERLLAFERMFAALPRPSADQPVLSARLSGEALGVLRGVGGITAAPPAAGDAARLSAQFTTPLTSTAERAQGLWVRQVTFDNPGN